MTDETANPEDETQVAESAEAETTDSPQLDIGSATAVAEAPKMASVIRGKVTAEGVALGTGRRKTSVARVRIQDGDGKLTINGRELGEYFTLERDQTMIMAPLKSTG